MKRGGSNRKDVRSIRRRRLYEPALYNSTRSTQTLGFYKIGYPQLSTELAGFMVATVGIKGRVTIGTKGYEECRCRSSKITQPNQNKGNKMNRIFVLAVVSMAAMTTIAMAEDSYRIATEGAYPPFNFVDASGKLQGFEIELGEALCAQMNAKCEFVKQDFDGTIPGILAGKYDFALTSMSITPERQKTVDFSEKYYSTAAVFTAPKDTTISDISPAGLNGKRVGAQSSTIHAAMLEDKYKDVEVRMYPTLDEALRDLEAGRIDTVFGDKLATAPWLQSEAGKCCKVVGGDITDASFGPGVGAAMKKGNDDLRNKLNAAINAVVDDGTYKSINDKYFPFSIY